MERLSLLPMTGMLLWSTDILSPVYKLMCLGGEVGAAANKLFQQWATMLQEYFTQRGWNRPNVDEGCMSDIDSEEIYRIHDPDMSETDSGSETEGYCSDSSSNA